MAELVRWDPFRDMMSLRSAMDRLFQDAWVAPGTAATWADGSGFPVDVSETEDHFTVTAVLPGVKADDLSITTQSNVLTIAAETKAPEPGDERNHLRERRFGHYTRQFTLPTDIHAEGVQARLEDGILYLTLPKAESAKPRRIQIAGAGEPKVLEANGVAS